MGWARVGASLAVVASALSGCASLMVEQALGPDPRRSPAMVERYEWAGRRGDELVVVYRVWSGRPKRIETRWTAIDLPAAPWQPGLAAPRVGELGDRADPVPDRGSVEPVPLVPVVGPEPLRAGERVDAIGVFARHGVAAELTVVARDSTGQLRSASWTLVPSEDLGPAESLPRALARTGAGVVDLGTAPLQLLLFMLGVLRVH